MPIGVVIGLDVGTRGIRALAVDAGGDVLAGDEISISDRNAGDSIHEQDPHEWWRCVCQAARSVCRELLKSDSSRSILGITATSTSGSLVLADTNGQPVRPAILYDDTRGALISEDLNSRLPPTEARFNSSYSLVKAAWVRQEEPAIWQRVCRLLHPADWLIGKVTGYFETTDYSNALKLGYDVEKERWSGAVALLEFSSDLFPKVVHPGTYVGVVSAQASRETGLPSGTPVLAGATDGMASLIASGAYLPGHANTTLGTTIVWKALSVGKPQLGPGMYCHRHPAELWAPGAASNSGPGSLRTKEADVTPADMDRLASNHLPSPSLCYLLRSRGERFPFLNPGADSFVEGNPPTPDEWYATQLQSLAFVERWGYERLEDCGVRLGDVVFSTGGAASSPVLSQLRANVLKRTISRCRYPVAAFGAATLAATESLYGGDLTAATRGMTHVCKSYQPDRGASAAFEPIYTAFRAACTRRGYL